MEHRGTVRDAAIAEARQEGQSPWKATGEDALNLIRHWKDEQAQLRCTHTSEGLGFSVTGRVRELSGFRDVDQRGQPAGPSAPLTACPTPIMGPTRSERPSSESPSDRFVSALELTLRNGDTFVMAEVRTASSPGDQSH